MNATRNLVWPALGAGLLAGVVAGVLVTVAVVAARQSDAEDQAGGPPPGGGPPPAMVRVGQADIQRLRHRIPVIGRLQEVRRVTVTSEIAGKVTTLAVDEGDAVAGGETKIAQIDDVWSRLRLESAEADVAAAEAELRQSRSDLTQLEQLRQAGSARSKEVDDARTLVAGNEARLAAAIADRDRSRVEVERARVVAPFHGAVSRKLAEAGQWVEPGDPLIEMISTGQIDAVVDVPERYIGSLGVGDPVEVVVEVVDVRVVGEVVSVRPDGTNASRTFPVKVRLDDPDDRLRIGMSAVAHVPITREDDFITVPRDAVLFSPGGAAVWYAASMGQPLPAALSEPVEVLFGVGADRYAVAPLPGAPFPALTPDTLVVIEGAERLFPTQPLDILNADETDPGPPLPTAKPSSGTDAAPDA
ncbi:MAG: efflux RND transporter periplasmic adaptor subunit [Planctomycetota bacterium]